MIDKPDIDKVFSLQQDIYETADFELPEVNSEEETASLMERLQNYLSILDL